tara:strand:+ start:10757 stop:11899 length:1143 start_codon:yes stop_codon:yes gene_type:complete
MKIKDKLKICSNCVMDNTDSQIYFDDEGVCDHCIVFKNKILPSWKFGVGHENFLQEKIDKIKRDALGKEFECIFGISGGIDSSFLLYKIVEDFGLKPLVFHVDAGWNSQIAVNNIEKLIEKLNLDLYTVVIDWEEMRDLQLSFFKSGVPHIDSPQDHAFFASMYKFASKYKVKNILTGGNFSTECVRNPKQWMYYQSDSSQLKDIQKKFGTKKLISFPFTNIIWHRFYLPYIKKIKTWRPLDLIPYNKNSAVKTLVEKFDFQEYPQKHFESRFTKFYESYWLYERFGYDTRKVQFSSLILTGQMKRDEALEILKSKPYDSIDIKKDFEFIANKLLISVDELKKYFLIPHKTYKDYKSNKYIYKIGSSISRLIGIEKGGKR